MALAIAGAIAGALLTGCAVGAPKPAIGVTDYGATFTGDVYSNQSGATAYWFRYGKTTAYGTTTPRGSIQIADENPHPVSQVVSGLQAATTYHYQLCAQDTQAGTGPGCGGDQTFVTLPPEDSVIGGGRVAIKNPFVDQGVFNVNAHSTPDGRSPHGTAAGLTNRGLAFGGPVTCLRVEGDHATIGTSTFVFFIDAAPSGESFSQAQAGSDPSACPPFATTLEEAVSGIVVHDSP